ncbi:hypothetical protein N7451_012641 [Penicillium sp. IBT 35674x]|nr:hypothetical protein N7451_012641 [Penicillium sp. IBT 35674x]
MLSRNTTPRNQEHYGSTPTEVALTAMSEQLPTWAHHAPRRCTRRSSKD